MYLTKQAVSFDMLQNVARPIEFIALYCMYNMCSLCKQRLDFVGKATGIVPSTCTIDEYNIREIQTLQFLASTVMPSSQ